jgi:hypothetical protein
MVASPAAGDEKSRGHIFVNQHAAFEAARQGVIQQVGIISTDGFMTGLRSFFQGGSHRSDLMQRRFHVCVCSGNFCRLPGCCGELATEFARALPQKSAEGVLVRRLRNLVRGLCVPRFFGELT